MREIKQDEQVLARLISPEDIKDGLNFFSQDNDFIQVGAWGYDAGKELQRHIHNKAERKIDRTFEVLYVIRGKLKAKIYDLNEVLIEEIVVKNGEMLVLLESGHGYEIMEDGTKVLEIKNGPYLGADIDRYRF